MFTTRRIARISLLSAALTVSLVGVANAGPIKFGEGMDALEVDDNGNLTEAGKKTAIKELDKIPGEDAWDMTFFAELNKGAAEGPIYIEFYDKIMGQWQLVFRHEDSNFDGNRKYRFNMVLEGNVGFNKDHTYRVKILQVGANGKDIELATSELKLINTGREPEEGEDSGEEEMSEQDKLDSFAGGDEEDEEEGGANADAVQPAGDAEPPAVEPKKGCSVDTSSDWTFNGLAIVMLLGIAGIRRRRA